MGLRLASERTLGFGPMPPADNDPLPAGEWAAWHIAPCYDAHCDVL